MVLELISHIRVGITFVHIVLGELVVFSIVPCLEVVVGMRLVGHRVYVQQGVLVGDAEVVVVAVRRLVRRDGQLGPVHHFFTIRGQR